MEYAFPARQLVPTSGSPRFVEITICSSSGTAPIRFTARISVTMVVGVGVGGTFEKCAILAKKALTRPVNEHSEIPYVADLEKEMLEKINKLGIGPGGLGGTTTALAVNINTYPTHIAGLPVAVNIC